MATEWRAVRLGAVCTKIGSGATPRGGSEVYLTNGPCALIRSQNVHNDGFHRTGLAYIGEDHATELAAVEVISDDVLLNITGDSVARACQVDESVLPARVNQHVAIIRPDPGKLDPRFLRYFLISPKMQSRLRSWAGAGGTRNALTKAMIESFEVPVPTSVAEQRVIAHILGTLDDKIELNRKMSETLEEMARALFKSWFVDFDPVRAKAEGRETGLPKEVADLFPAAFEDSELGQIPKGWWIGTFGNVVDHSRVQDDPRTAPGEAFLHYSIPAYDAGKMPVREAGDGIKSTKFKVGPKAILLSKLNPEIERVWLVDIEDRDRAVCSTEFLVLYHTSPFSWSYAYCLARSNGFRRALEGLVTGTSKSHQRAQPDDILALPVVHQHPRFAYAFDKIVGPMLKRTLAARKENTTLTDLRDALLPQLISGKLRVKDAERFVQEAV